MERKVKVTHEDLFYDIQEVSKLVSRLGGIVQNEGITVSKEELLEWVHLANEAVDRLCDAKRNVIKFYYKS
jgi:hypothetical protein